MNPLQQSRSKLVLLGTSILLGLAVLQLSWIGVHWGGETHQALLGNMLAVFPSLIAAPLSLVIAFKHRGKVRRGWLFVGLGVTAQAVGNSLWSYLNRALVHDQPII